VDLLHEEGVRTFQREATDNNPEVILADVYERTRDTVAGRAESDAARSPLPAAGTASCAMVVTIEGPSQRVLANGPFLIRIGEVFETTAVSPQIHRSFELPRDRICASFWAHVRTQDGARRFHFKAEQ
jgi:hypothetical protein